MEIEVIFFKTKKNLIKNVVDNYKIIKISVLSKNLILSQLL